ncbi:MAG: mercuric transporter MerT family protein [Alphaproteobacteria bacterium]
MKESTEVSLSQDGHRDRDRRPAVTGSMATGALLTAIGASTCCVIPFAMISAGAGGAWLGNLVIFAPFKSYFIAASLLSLGAGLWMVYRKPKSPAGADAVPCASMASVRIIRAVLWTAAGLIAATMSFPYWAPLLG